MLLHRPLGGSLCSLFPSGLFLLSLLLCSVVVLGALLMVSLMTLVRLSSLLVVVTLFGLSSLSGLWEGNGNSRELGVCEDLNEISLFNKKD